MASYCTRCGDRQAIPEPHRCTSCAQWTLAFELDNESFGQLWHASIRTVIDDIGIQEIIWSRLIVAGAAAMHAGSWFDPTPPGSLALSLGRPPEETCLSLIHEMGHAMLSIKQQSEYSRHPRGEELIVNGAADVVCHRYAILDYAPRMQAIGLRACLAFAELSGTIQARAMRVAGQLLENMDRHSAVQATRTPIGLAEE